MKVLVAVKRVVDSNVRVQVKADNTGIDVTNVKMSMNTTRAQRLIQDLKAEAAGGPLLGAGFGKNSQRFVELFISNFQRYAGRMSW